jgi:hypothetical protein
MPLKPIFFSSTAEYRQFFDQRRSFTAEDLIVSTNGYTYFSQDIKQSDEECEEKIEFFVNAFDGKNNKIVKTISLQDVKKKLNDPNDQKQTFTYNDVLFNLLEQHEKDDTQFPECPIKGVVKNPIVSIPEHTYESESINRYKSLRNVYFYMELKKIEDLNVLEAARARLKKLRNEFAPNISDDIKLKSTEAINTLVMKNQELKNLTSKVRYEPGIISQAAALLVTIGVVTALLLLLIFVPAIPILIPALGLIFLPMPLSWLVTISCSRYFHNYYWNKYANKLESLQEDDGLTRRDEIKNLDVILDNDELKKRHCAISIVEGKLASTPTVDSPSQEVNHFSGYSFFANTEVPQSPVPNDGSLISSKSVEKMISTPEALGELPVCRNVCVS